MGEYDRTGNGQSSKTDWDLRSILCDIAKNWWVILLIACSAAMITYTVLTAVHRDQYTVKTTFAVMGRGENANAESSLSSTYEMTQKFQAILENNILKKKVMEELGCSSFPADMSASIVPESNLMELSVTADSDSLFIVETKESLPERELVIAHNEKVPVSKAAQEFLSYF